MQIFIKGSDGKTITLAVEPTDTIAEVKAKHHEKTGQPLNTYAFLYQSKRLEDEKTVSAYGIQKESTLEVKLTLGRPPVRIEGHSAPAKPVVEPDKYDPEVKGVMPQRFQALSGKKYFVFIGIGSYDHGHPDGEASIRRQQCPQWVIDECARRQLPLHIILIDVNYKAPPGRRPPQIYDLDGKWKLEHELYGGLVRHFKDASGNCLSTYATDVQTREYAGESHTIAGVNLEDLGKSIAAKKGCFVSGNFYAEKAKPHVIYPPELQKK